MIHSIHFLHEKMQCQFDGKEKKHFVSLKSFFKTFQGGHVECSRIRESNSRIRERNTLQRIKKKKEFGWGLLVDQSFHTAHTQIEMSFHTNRNAEPEF